MTDQSKKLEKMEPEETALWMEDMLSQITTRLSAGDLRDQNMGDQVGNILQTITVLQDDNSRISGQLASTQKELAETKATNDAQIDDLRKALAALENKTLMDQKVKERMIAEQTATAQTLEAERQFNRKYNEIQSYFGASEAEVYKRGNQLIVRLKGIQFPVGTAIITPENYSLLSKVQRAIENFENPSVVIEGHSDSTGTDEMNKVLSRQRADAVKDYLVANKTLPADKVVSPGHGSDRPVASNATPEGRAANRRIDVIVTPSLRPGQL